MQMTAFTTVSHNFPFILTINFNFKFRFLSIFFNSDYKSACNAWNNFFSFFFSLSHMMNYRHEFEWYIDCGLTRFLSGSRLTRI